MTHQNPTISFKEYDLDFMAIDPNEGAYDEETGDQLISDEEILERMETSIPGDAVFLGSLRNEIDHSPGLTWVLKDDFYIMPWHADSQFDWAVFRISWDDNYGRWEWQTDVRIKGTRNKRTAAKSAIGALFDSWGYDLNADENEVYSDFLKEM